MRFFKFIFGFLILFILDGCTKEVDFNQIDEAEINNNLLLTFAYFNLKNSDFSEEIKEISDTIQFPIDGSLENSLKRVEFKIAAENSFDNKFNIEIRFLDSIKNPFYSLTRIIIPANSGEIEIPIVIPEEEVYNIFEMEYVEFLVVKLGDAQNSDENSELVLKSSMELFFNFKNE